MRAAGLPGAFVVRGRTTRGAALEPVVVGADAEAPEAGAIEEGGAVVAETDDEVGPAVGDAVSRAAFLPPLEEQAVSAKVQARARGTRRMRTLPVCLIAVRTEVSDRRQRAQRRGTRVAPCSSRPSATCSGACVDLSSPGSVLRWCSR